MLKIDEKIIRFRIVKILKNHDEINVFTQKSLNLALEIHPTFEKSLEFKVLIWMKKNMKIHQKLHIFLVYLKSNCFFDEIFQSPKHLFF